MLLAQCIKKSIKYEKKIIQNLIIVKSKILKHMININKLKYLDIKYKNLNTHFSEKIKYSKTLKINLKFKINYEIYEISII